MKLSAQLYQQGELTMGMAKALPKMESPSIDALRGLLINQAAILGYFAQVEERIEAATEEFNEELHDSFMQLG